LLLFDTIVQPAADPHSHAKFVLDVLDKGIKAAAVILAGIWTAINYFRGRTFAKRLEFGHAGRFFYRDGRGYVVLQIRMKNVGLSKVGIRQRGSGCELFGLTARDLYPVANADPQRVFRLFLEHHWIESQEEIIQEEIVSLGEFAQDTTAIRLKMTVISNRLFRKRGIIWQRSFIVELAPRRDAETHATN
jgi:hypothetical protein